MTPADSRTYVYDELERLTSADDGLGAQVETYAYDLEGNRTTSHLSVGYAPTDEINRIDSDDTFSYVHDDNGNLITKTENAAPFGVTDYVYDVQDQLVQVTRPDLSVITYAYDALGRRIEKNVAGTITRYVYDGEDIAPKPAGRSK